MQFRDLKAQYQRYKTEIDTAVQKVLNDTAFIGGPEVAELEQELAAYTGVKHCISCANGTEAMTLVLMAWGIGPGDAVFVPDFTFFSTGEVVSFSGATPVFVDVDSKTFNIDPIKLEEAINRVKVEGILKPKAVIPVDLFGLPAAYPALEKIAASHNLFLLEDGAQGFGGRISSQKALSFGQAATTSFFPAKPLGCYGDGGAIFTDDSSLAELINSLKVHGKGHHKYDNVRIGLNSRLDTIQAAILKVKLKAFVEQELEAVNQVYLHYNELLEGLVELPYIPKNYYSSFAQYTIKLKNQAERDALQAYLKAAGIPSAIYYQKPMHSQDAFANLTFSDDDYPVTNRLCETVLSLPMHPYLSEADITRISKEVEAYIKNQ
ncbi:MAG: DegT/DnrJ/EryC1/StrS family aminotransferase [Dethiobacteria bacterium]|nr:DegT/DnrJ/EryC1/StrS family aminotransferase [Dethiobacteria bacterium]